MESEKKVSSRTIAAILFCAFAGLYLSTRTSCFDYDSLIIALDMEQGLHSFSFHPNHLFSPAPGWLLYQVLQGLGYAPRALYVMVFSNAMVGGLCIAYFYSILLKRFAPVWALCGALCLGLCQAYWLDAVDGRVYAMAGLVSCFLLDMLFRLDASKAVRSGLAMGIACVFHEMFLLTIPAYAVLLWRRSRGLRPKQISRRFGLFCGACFTVMAAAYLFVTRYLLQFSFQRSFEWLSSPSGNLPGMGALKYSAWSFHLGDNAAASLKAFENSFLTPQVWSWPFEFRLIHVLTLLGISAAAYGSWKVIHSKKNGSSDLLVSLWTWVIVMNVFQWVWNPGAVRLRILFIPAAIALILELEKQMAKRRAWIAPLAGMMVAMMGTLNFRFSIRPAMNPENNHNLVRLAWISEQLSPKDAFLYWGTLDDSTILNLYVVYFMPRLNARSLHGVLFQNLRDGLSVFDRMAAEARQAGGRTYLDGALLDPVIQREAEHAGGLAPGTVSQWIGQFHTKTVLRGPGGYTLLVLH